MVREKTTARKHTQPRPKRPSTKTSEAGPSSSNPPPPPRPQGETFNWKNLEERARHEFLKDKPVMPCHYLDILTLRRLGLEVEMNALLVRTGLSEFMQMRYPSHPRLMLEFFCTLKKKKGVRDELEFRIGRNRYMISPELLREVFHLPAGDMDFVDPHFKQHEAWRAFTGQGQFVAKSAQARLFIEPCWLLLHKLICYALLGKHETNKVARMELFLMHALNNGVPVSLPHFLMKALEKQTSEKKRRSLGLGHIVAGLALHFQIIPSLRDPRSIFLEPTSMTVEYLVKSGLATPNYKVVPHATRVRLALRRPAEPEVEDEETAEEAEHEATDTAEETAEEAEDTGIQRASGRHQAAADHPSSSRAEQETVGWEQAFQTLASQNQEMLAILHQQGTAIAQLQREQRRTSWRIRRYLRQQGFEDTPPPSPHED